MKNKFQTETTTTLSKKKRIKQKIEVKTFGEITSRDRR